MEHKPLWEYTRDLHHACEAHIVGGAMATGNPPRICVVCFVVLFSAVLFSERCFVVVLFGLCLFSSLCSWCCVGVVSW